MPPCACRRNLPWRAKAWKKLVDHVGLTRDVILEPQYAKVQLLKTPVWKVNAGTLMEFMPFVKVFGTAYDKCYHSTRRDKIEADARCLLRCISLHDQIITLVVDADVELQIMQKMKKRQCQILLKNPSMVGTGADYVAAHYKAIEILAEGYDPLPFAADTIIRRYRAYFLNYINMVGILSDTADPAKVAILNKKLLAYCNLRNKRSNAKIARIVRAIDVPSPKRYGPKQWDPTLALAASQSEVLFSLIITRASLRQDCTMITIA